MGRPALTVYGPAQRTGLAGGLGLSTPTASLRAAFRMWLDRDKPPAKLRSGKRASLSSKSQPEKYLRRIRTGGNSDPVGWALWGGPALKLGGSARSADSLLADYRGRAASCRPRRSSRAAGRPVPTGAGRGSRDLVGQSRPAPGKGRARQNKGRREREDLGR